MLQVIVAVRDSVADIYFTPRFERSEGSAIRGFSDAINHAVEDNVLFKHPEQFDLYVLGTFDDVSGVFVTHLPRMVISGNSAVIRVEDKTQRSLKLA